jgi:hypothetical protein
LLKSIYLDSNQLGFTEVFIVVHSCPAIGADISGVLENFFDFGVSLLVIQLTGMKGAMFFGIDAVLIGHNFLLLFLNMISRDAIQSMFMSGNRHRLIDLDENHFDEFQYFAFWSSMTAVDKCLIP